MPRDLNNIGAQRYAQVYARHMSDFLFGHHCLSTSFAATLIEMDLPTHGLAQFATAFSCGIFRSRCIRMDELHRSGRQSLRAEYLLRH